MDGWIDGVIGSKYMVHCKGPFLWYLSRFVGKDDRWHPFPDCPPSIPRHEASFPISIPRLTYHLYAVWTKGMAADIVEIFKNFAFIGLTPIKFPLQFLYYVVVSLNLQFFFNLCYSCPY